MEGCSPRLMASVSGEGRPVSRSAAGRRGQTWLPERGPGAGLPAFPSHAGLRPGMRLGARHAGAAALSPGGGRGGAGDGRPSPARVAGGATGWGDNAGLRRAVPLAVKGRDRAARLPRGWRARRGLRASCGRSCRGARAGRECCALHATALKPGRKAWACRGADGGRLEGRESWAGEHRAAAEGGGRGRHGRRHGEKNANTDVSVFFALRGAATAALRPLPL